MRNLFLSQQQCICARVFLLIRKDVWLSLPNPTKLYAHKTTIIVIIIFRTACYSRCKVVLYTSKINYENIFATLKKWLK